ncbi:hypothetical protein DFH09DRAFT_1029837 [Mycena vulgaris]|nr:hypothetical protein DFH09DRAFT_1029837 [Mycena vulgaris]
MVKTFHPRHLEKDDFIKASRLSILRLRLPTTTDAPVHISLRRLGVPNTIAEERVRGFLYYHLPYPSQFLSGGLRFRACDAPTPGDFDAGYDILEPSGLPWTVPLAHIIARKRSEPAERQLERDRLVTREQCTAARRMKAVKHTLEDWPPTFLYDLAQTFLIDLARPTEVGVLGPHALVRTNIYPAVAHIGFALVRFERTKRDGELCLRVLRPLGECAYLPEFAHLPPVREGTLLPDPKGRTLKGRALKGHALAPRPWMWTYDDSQPARAAALHCLLNPIQHFPPPPGLPLPPPDASVESNVLPPDAFASTPLDVFASKGADMSSRPTVAAIPVPASPASPATPHAEVTTATDEPRGMLYRSRRPLDAASSPLSAVSSSDVDASAAIPASPAPASPATPRAEGTIPKAATEAPRGILYRSRRPLDAGGSPLSAVSSSDADVRADATPASPAPASPALPRAQAAMAEAGTGAVGVRYGPGSARPPSGGEAVISRAETAVLEPWRLRGR